MGPSGAPERNCKLMKEIKISDIKGIRIGHAENLEGGTGVTAIISDNGATAGADVRGGGPATFQTDCLRSENTIEIIQCVLLTGGSGYGARAVTGALRYLEENEIGFKTDEGVVPIICGASIYDLELGDSKCRPDADMGYEACKNSEKNDPREGAAGAGAGATAGKLRGSGYMMKTGQGIYAAQQGNLKIGAIAVVNALGDIIDVETGRPLAGMLNLSKDGIADTVAEMIEGVEIDRDVYNTNTTISCIITNAKITKTQCNKLASVAHNAYAKAIHPVHTGADGDTIFVLATGEVDVYPDALGVFATEVLAKAINRAATQTEPSFGLKSAQSFL